MEGREYSQGMQSNTLSRRAFTHLLGAGAAVAAFPRIALASPRTRELAVRLSANENPYGPSPAALRAMRDAMRLAWRYPDEAQDTLVESIARLHRVSTSEVLVGDGSGEILKLTAAAFTGPQRKLVTADPTFEAIGQHAKAANAEVVKVPLDAAFAHDLQRMLEAVGSAGVIYVCNPNNPTATITPKDALKAFLDAAPQSVTVLVDEAYHHYASSPAYESVIPLVAKHPNLIVSRTFSKIFGMAGLRCGYCIAQKEMIEKLARQQAWDSVNVIALAAATASLGDAVYVAEGQRRNQETKRWLTTALRELGLSHLPSEANFVMIDMRREVGPLIIALRDRGVRVGRLFPALPKHLRVTIGKPDQMRVFVGALREAIA